MNWAAIVPVKGNPGAKSRFGAHPERAQLAEAFAMDTVAALLASPTVARVFVVTADAQLATKLAALGATIVRELPQKPPSTAAKGAFVATHEPAERHEPAEPPSPPDPLNAAIRQGMDAARQACPDANIAVVTGDLPALTVADVEAAIALAAAHERSMVPDAEGMGTTMLLALAGASFTPQFGPGSRAAHEAAGHMPLELPAIASIRRDVDTPDNLAEARRLGVGRYTAALIEGTSATPSVR